MTDIKIGEAHHYKMMPVTIDWESNFIDSIVGQILNNEEAKKNYISIIAMALLKIKDRLDYEEKTSRHD